MSITNYVSPNVLNNRRVIEKGFILALTTSLIIKWSGNILYSSLICLSLFILSAIYNTYSQNNKK